MRDHRQFTMAMLMLSAAPVGLLAPGVARAQDAAATSAGQPEDAGAITVTARRRSETLTNVPLSISALSGDQLEKRSVRNVRDLANNTPGLTFTMGGTPSSSVLVVRGLSSSNFATSLNNEANVGFFIDGIYQTNRNAIDLLDVIDIGQISVAKGPQSALYGRSTFAGAIGISTSEAPRKPTYAISGTLGSDADRRISASVGGPIIDGILSGSIKGSYVTFGGTINNSDGAKLGGYTHQGLSGSLRFTPTDSLTFKLSGLLAEGDALQTGGFLVPYGEQNCGGTQPQTGARYIYCGEVKPRGSDVSGNIPASHSTIKQIALESRYENQAFSIVSTTGLTRSNFRAYFDYDVTRAGDVYGVCTVVGTNCPTVGGLATYGRTVTAQSTGGNQQNVKSFSQELRIQSPDRNRFQWLAGAFFFDSRADEGSYVAVDGSQLAANERLVLAVPALAASRTGPLANFANPGLSPDVINLQRLASFTKVSTKAYSLFGSLGYEIVPGLKVSAEGRYNIERKTNNNLLSFFAPGTGLQQDTFKSFTPRFTVEYKVTPDILLYANAAKGVRSGGFNGVTGVLPSESVYKEESNWTYEVGAKGEVLDRKLVFQLAAFQIDWSDVQVPSYSDNTAVVQSIIRNLGSLRARGFDASIDVRPVRGVSFGGSASYSDPKYGKNVYDPSQVTQCAGTTVCRYIDVPGRGLQPLVSGNRPPRSVGWQWNAHADLGGALSGDWSWSGRVDVNHTGPATVNALNLSTFGKRTLTNLRIGVETDVFNISLWATNLFDKSYVSTALTQPRNGYPSTLRTIEAYLGERRRAGVTVSAKF